MEIMRTTSPRFTVYLTAAACLTASATAFAAGQSTLQNIAVLSVANTEQGAAYQLAARTDAAGASLLSDNPAVGYAVVNGPTTVLVALPKITTIDAVSFLNRGAKGQVSIATSNVKLSANSPRWRQVARQALSGSTVKAMLGPNEAKYVRITFDVTEPGQISALGVYSPSNAGTYALLARAVESDGKTVGDGKDLADSKDAKDIPAEGEESPAEGPAPGLPDPPPFTFVPQLVPTSP
jgi:hypothetical protein